MEQLRTKVRIIQSLEAIHSNGHNNPLSNKNITRENAYGCGHDFQRDQIRECPVWGSTCRKCNKPNHWENVCGQLPTRRWLNQGQVRGRENRSMVNEISNSATSLNGSNTVPKQVLDLVDVANSVDNLSHKS